jgi:hypothetical protein
VGFYVFGCLNMQNNYAGTIKRHNNTMMMLISLFLKDSF